ncbi:bacillithiol biosynthesis cysteine-adding enzyme BshC [Bacillaceae bacterium W0354]
MDVHCITLEQQSNLIKDYKNRKESIYTQFHYDPYQLKSFRNRYNYLITQEYKRQELVDILKEQNIRWGADDSVLTNIDQLNDPKSVVVIGGQQTGLLTGPLYTIHKIISIIIQAKEQSEHLKIPVIPLFWMAGEDHDFEEINHVFTYESNRLKKHRLEDYHVKKVPVSARKLDLDKVEKWMLELFSTFQETEHTKAIYHSLQETMKKSETYVDFFASIINEMFKNEGLVLVDSNCPKLRELERDYFLEIINNRDKLASVVVQELNNQLEKGYHISLDATTEDGHLFYHLNGERLLLYKVDGKWMTKDGQVTFMEEELINQVKESPQLFSNNVVTRPLMQEFVFPVLSFIAGPGEIAYWSVLNRAFHTLNLQMPIVTPRLSITLLLNHHQRQIKQMELNLDTMIDNGTSTSKLNWLKRQTYLPVDDVINEVKSEIEKIHQPIQELASTIQPDLHSLSETNLLKIKEELEFLRKRLNKALKTKNKDIIHMFDELEWFYHPNNGLQERVWNVYYFLNFYGPDLPKFLLNTPPMWEQDHLLVTI